MRGRPVSGINYLPNIRHTVGNSTYGVCGTRMHDGTLRFVICENRIDSYAEMYSKSIYLVDALEEAFSIRTEKYIIDNPDARVVYKMDEDGVYRHHWRREHE